MNRNELKLYRQLDKRYRRYINKISKNTITGMRKTNKKLGRPSKWGDSAIKNAVDKMKQGMSVKDLKDSGCKIPVSSLYYYRNKYLKREAISNG